MFSWRGYEMTPLTTAKLGQLVYLPFATINKLKSRLQAYSTLLL